MELINYPRFLKAIDEAIQGLELEARCYGYLEDPEHIELIRMLKEYEAKIKEEKQRAHIEWKEKMTAGIQYFKVCRVRCKLCGDVLEHINKTKDDNHNGAIWCSCQKVMLDPSASFYRIGGHPDDYEDLSEEWEGESMTHHLKKWELVRALVD